MWGEKCFHPKNYNIYSNVLSKYFPTHHEQSCKEKSFQSTENVSVQTFVPLSGCGDENGKKSYFFIIETTCFLHNNFFRKRETN